MPPWTEGRVNCGAVSPAAVWRTAEIMGCPGASAGRAAGDRRWQRACGARECRSLRESSRTRQAQWSRSRRRSDGAGRVPLVELAIESHAVELRHPEVAQDGVVRAGGDSFQRLPAILGGIDLVALQGQSLGNEQRHQWLVINDQDAVATGLGGRRMLGGHWSGSPRHLYSSARPFTKPRKPKGLRSFPGHFLSENRHWWPSWAPVSHCET